MTQTKTFVVTSEHGLHARPATVLVQAAMAFQARIMVSCNRATADAKSLLALLMLGATKGTKLTITADGIDAADALHAIQQTNGLSEAAN